MGPILRIRSCQHYVNKRALFDELAVELLQCVTLVAGLSYCEFEISLAPPLNLSTPYCGGRKLQKNLADFAEVFVREKLAGSPQLSSIGAGERIFLRDLRTIFGSPIPDFV